MVHAFSGRPEAQRVHIIVGNRSGHAKELRRVDEVSHVYFLHVKGYFHTNTGRVFFAGNRKSPLLFF